MRVPSGQPVRLDFEVTDLSGELVDPGSVRMQLLSPDTDVPADIAVPAHDGTGLYHSILDTDIEDFGHYAWVFSTTDPGKTVRNGVIDVFDPFAQELLGLDDGKKYLNISLDNPTHDDEILGFIRTLTPAVEYLAGSVEPKTVRRFIDGGGYSLVLPHAPIISLTSLAFYGTAFDTTTLTVDNESGMIYPTDGTIYLSHGRWYAVYVAGRRIIPEAMSHAAKVILAHLWETQRGRGAVSTAVRRGNSDDTTVLPGFGFSIPNRAVELLKPLGTRTGLAT